MAQKNPLVEFNRRAMNYIWQKVPKTLRDGVEYVTYQKTDILYLYNSGLVDTKRFKFEHYEQAFADCLGDDGQYWVSHEKMLFLGMFRYSKAPAEPFDPLKMRVGKWPVERLWEVYKRSIIPSTSIPKEFMTQKFDQIFRKEKSIEKAVSKDFEDVDDEKAAKEIDKTAKEIDKKYKLIFEGEGSEEMVEITKEHLVNTRNFLDTYPSARRKIEMAVLEMKMGKLQELANLASEGQKSGFEFGKDFRDTTKKDLKDMLVKASEDRTGGRKTTGEEIDIKKMQKKRPRPTKF